MAKVAYIEKNFKQSSIDIIRQANDIIEEYQAEGFNLTLRQLYYQFVSRDLIRNKQTEYKRLGSIISDARLAGLVDWEAIEDRTRELKSLTHWDNPGQIVSAAARSFRLDHWEGQEVRPEVWIEKEALVGVISGICEELDVAYFACKGYVSQSEMWKASRRFRNRRYGGQATVIIHLGDHDHDPSGVDMTRDITDRQDLFRAYDCKVERIALNMDQIDKYGPPPNPAKITDSWELDALEPKILSSLIENTVVNYRDMDILETVLEKEIVNLTPRSPGAQTKEIYTMTKRKKITKAQAEKVVKIRAFLETKIGSVQGIAIETEATHITRIDVAFQNATGLYVLGEGSVPGRKAFSGGDRLSFSDIHYIYTAALKDEDFKKFVAAYDAEKGPSLGSNAPSKGRPALNGPKTGPNKDEGGAS